MYAILLSPMRVGACFSLVVGPWGSKGMRPDHTTRHRGKVVDPVQCENKSERVLEFSFLSFLLERMSFSFPFSLMRGCLALPESWPMGLSWGDPGVNEKSRFGSPVHHDLRHD